MELIRATESDVGDYIRIGQQVISRFNCVAVDPGDVLEEIQGSVVYMIHSEGRAVGIVSYKMLAPDHAYISEVQVEPAFQGKGIGGLALGSILKELEGVSVVDLYTHPENPAQRLYGRYGFRPTGEILENHYGSGEPRMRMILKRA